MRSSFSESAGCSILSILGTHAMHSETLLMPTSGDSGGRIRRDTSERLDRRLGRRLFLF